MWNEKKKKKNRNKKTKKIKKKGEKNEENINKKLLFFRNYTDFSIFLKHNFSSKELIQTIMAGGMQNATVSFGLLKSNAFHVFFRM